MIILYGKGNFMFDAILDALLDSLKILPYVFVLYVIIELVERKVSVFKNGKILSGKHAPLFGSLFGAFPQCGISVMSAKLYEKHIIRLGTLLAVFISTSDEAFFLLISSGKWLALVMLLLTKIIVASIVGYAVNLIIGKKETLSNEKAEFSHEEICAHCTHEHDLLDGEHHDHKETKHEILHEFVLVPLKHCISTFLFVLAVNLVFGTLVYLIGEDKITRFMQTSRYFQPVVTSIIGLIPNCASSVLITQLYVKGGITFGALFAGLSVNAGLGIAVMLKNKKELKKNLLALLILFVISVCVGLLIDVII